MKRRTVTVNVEVDEDALWSQFRVDVMRVNGTDDELFTYRTSVELLDTEKRNRR